MKTIEEWFNTIKEKTPKTKALRNTPEESLSYRQESLESAFESAFVWKDSPEGHDYWARFIDKKCR